MGMKTTDGKLPTENNDGTAQAQNQGGQNQRGGGGGGGPRTGGWKQAFAGLDADLLFRVLRHYRRDFYFADGFPFAYLEVAHGDGTTAKQLPEISYFGTTQFTQAIVDKLRLGNRLQDTKTMFKSELGLQKWSELQAGNRLPDWLKD